MKPWQIKNTTGLQVREAIAQQWRTHSDAEIGAVFGVSGGYIAKTRSRMGLFKSLAVRKAMTDTIRWVEKTKRPQSQNRRHRRMTDLERLDRAQARKYGARGVLSDLPMSTSEHKEYMRSLGYEIY